MSPARTMVLAVLALVAGSPALAQPVTIHSEAGRFTLRISGLARSEPLNRLHGFDLALETADGRPLAGASIALAGRRNTSPNPLPTSPRVAPVADEGRYRVEGLRFHMPGEWRLVFDIEFAQIRDRATLDVAVK